MSGSAAIAITCTRGRMQSRARQTLLATHVFTFTAPAFCRGTPGQGCVAPIARHGAPGGWLARGRKIKGPKGIRFKQQSATAFLCARGYESVFNRPHHRQYYARLIRNEKGHEEDLTNRHYVVAGDGENDGGGRVGARASPAGVGATAVARARTRTASAKAAAPPTQVWRSRRAASVAEGITRRAAGCSLHRTRTGGRRAVAVGETVVRTAHALLPALALAHRRHRHLRCARRRSLRRLPSRPAKVLCGAAHVRAAV